MYVYLNCVVEACGAQKRFKAMSPSSMTMPTTSAWEMGQGLSSPYSALPPPDMQCEFVYWLFNQCGILNSFRSKKNKSTSTKFLGIKVTLIPFYSCINIPYQTLIYFYS